MRSNLHSHSTIHSAAPPATTLLIKPKQTGLCTPTHALWAEKLKTSLKVARKSSHAKHSTTLLLTLVGKKFTALAGRKRAAFTAVLLTALLTGCQSAPFSEQTSAPVIPRENATFDTSGFGETKNDAIGKAMNNAAITCRQHKGTRVVVIQDKVKYNGIIDEKTGALIDKAGQVIGILSGQKMPKAASNTDYEAQITFKCVQ